MMEFANKSQFCFDVNPETVSIATAGDDTYQTPVNCRETMGDLARLSYLKSVLSGSIELDSAASPVFGVRLTDGTTDLADVVVTFASATRMEFSIDLDLSIINGATALYLALDVDTAVASRTAKLAGKLTVEHPIVIAG